MEKPKPHARRARLVPSSGSSLVRRWTYADSESDQRLITVKQWFGIEVMKLLTFEQPRLSRCQHVSGQRCGANGNGGGKNGGNPTGAETCILMPINSPLPKQYFTQRQVRAINSMRRLPFPYVTVTTGQFGKRKNIASVDQAAVWLVARWPIRNGDKLQAAKEICLEALDGKVTCTVARDAFIEAAKEAGIYFTREGL